MNRVEQLWVMIEQFDLFESWWGWLREFRADGAGLAAGNVLPGTVVPPVPCRLRVDVRLQRCDRPRSVEAAVDGDLRGRAVLRLQDAGGGTRVAVAWSLEMRSVPLHICRASGVPGDVLGSRPRGGHGGLRVPAASAARRGRCRRAGLGQTAGPGPALTGVPRPAASTGPRRATRPRCGRSRRHAARPAGHTDQRPRLSPWPGPGGAADVGAADARGWWCRAIGAGDHAGRASDARAGRSPRAVGGQYSAGAIAARPAKISRLLCICDPAREAAERGRGMGHLTLWCGTCTDQDHRDTGSTSPAPGRPHPPARRLGDTAGHLSASDTTARATATAEDQSEVRTVTTLIICSAVCALTMLAALLDAACRAASNGRWVPESADGRPPGRMDPDQGVRSWLTAAGSF